MYKCRHLLLLPPLLVLLAGCGTLSGGTRSGPESWSGDETLTLIVTELRMHLREDAYRYDPPATADNRSVFAVLLWKLDRLKQERGLPLERWENVDFVVEFARGRALERLRRYADARKAYVQVSESGSILADLAADSADAMAVFAELIRAPESPLSDEAKLELIELRIDSWRSMAAHFRGDLRSMLAWEEVEAWQTLRVDWFARRGDSERALMACHQLIEHNRDSKLQAQHLIRLGDLYAAAARRSRLHQRTKLGPSDDAAYEQLLEKAFSAYELAGDARKPRLRREAETRIEALMAFHEGGHEHAP